MNAWLAGAFAFAAVHYAIQWSFSRSERVLLLFSIQCGLYSALSLAQASLLRATTISDFQAALDHAMAFGTLSHAAALQVYAYACGRRDCAFRASATVAVLALVVLNQWVPLRGTVIAVESIQLPGGGVGMLSVRTPPGALLVLLYLVAVVSHGYGLFVARTLWRGDRSGALLVAASSAAILAGIAIGIMIDFAGVKLPYVGALLCTFFVLSMATFLSREYSARGAELRAHRERLEELVATRTLELHEAKEEAERASQIKSRFLAHMSHEIRNPLHVMVLNAQLIELQAGIDAAQRKMLQNVQRSGEHLSMLINDVLEMSRIQAGRLALVAGPFDLAATIDDVAQMFASQAASKGTELTVEFDSELRSPIVGDSGKVKQILVNLVSNAVKFTQDGSIHVTATVVADMDDTLRVEIAVEDTGIGIEPQDLTRMFQPFEQLDAGARVGGTGLGLAISQAHARRMGGDLQVASTPGVGSTFTCTFVAKGDALETAGKLSGQAKHLDIAMVSSVAREDAEDDRDLLGKVGRAVEAYASSPPGDGGISPSATQA